jgi:Baseplate J-like protein
MDIKYLNKDFSSFKSDLIEFAKAYYPTVYNDFTQASPGSMFIDMASYVGDVLSFYLDNQIQESYLEYSKQKPNLYSLSYMMGYKPKVTSAAVVELDVYQVVNAVNTPSFRAPDFTYALTIQPGMIVRSSVNNSSVFYVPEKVDFTLSSSLDPTDITVYQIDGYGQPNSYLLKKSTYAFSGQPKSVSFTFGSAQRFSKVTIQDTNIVSIVSAIDSNGNTWYEVPYLAQDFILQPVENTAANYPNFYQYANQVPYVLEKIKVPRRFTTRFRSDSTLEIEFGPGVNSVADSAVLPDFTNVGIGTINGVTLLNTAFDPTNFVTTQTYGLAPSNTTITFNYLVGGGASSNALSNELTIPVSFTATGLNTSLQNTVVTNNPEPAVGGGDGDSIEELRQNIAGEFGSQLRAVTQDDYLSRVLSMPSKFGKVSKAFVSKDDSTYKSYIEQDISERDQLLVSLYVLGLDFQGNLAVPSSVLMKNIQTYLSEYRMLTDAVNVKPAYIINIGVNFEVVTRPNYQNKDVIARVITQLQQYFATENWQINQPIILSDLYSTIDTVDGVQTVKKVEIVNLFDQSLGYSQNTYDMQAATLNGVIYPSLDPSIFEVKFPNQDIQGRVVTY